MNDSHKVIITRLRIRIRKLIMNVGTIMIGLGCPLFFVELSVSHGSRTLGAIGLFLWLFGLTILLVSSLGRVRHRRFTKPTFFEISFKIVFWWGFCMTFIAICMMWPGRIRFQLNTLIVTLFTLIGIVETFLGGLVWHRSRTGFYQTNHPQLVEDTLVCLMAITAWIAMFMLQAVGLETLASDVLFSTIFLGHFTAFLSMLAKPLIDKMTIDYPASREHEDD